MEKAPILLTPFQIQIEDATFTVWEVLKLPPDRYNCTITINYNNIESKRYPLIVKNEKDLRNKLKIELTKLKFIRLSLGDEVLRKVMTK